MKKALIFTGLKVVESLGIGGILYLCWMFGNYMRPDLPWYVNTLAGLCMSVVILAGTWLVGFGTWLLIKLNLEWADKLSKRG
jgi:hypothetical protein